MSKGGFYMTIQERISGIILLILGFAVSIYSIAELELGTITQPGPGLMPFISGAGIAILSILWFVTNLKKLEKKSAPLWQKGELKNPLRAVIIITLYAALMVPLGYILSTAVFLVAWQLLIEKEKLLKTAVITIVGTAIMFFLFYSLLGVPLPEGILSI
jgi:putative tricarboxylic transport membrane protein